MSAVGADLRRDLGVGAAVGDQFARRRHVDAVDVRVAHGRRGRREEDRLAPDSRAICTISRLVVPRTIESSTSSTFLPLNSMPIALSFWRTDFRRTAWPGMMNVRPM
jgi:hypothetical protein